MADQTALYEQQYAEKAFERCELFDLIASSFDIDSCLYPGSFVHCTPSFYFRTCCYVDTDVRAARFFKSSSVLRFISDRAVYAGRPVVRFHQQSYQEPLPEPEESFDLLLSLYAGFVSPDCGRYLRPGGLLVANNSHGDASMASLDPEFRFAGAIHCRNSRCRLDTTDLSRYFVSKRNLEITRGYLRKMKRGVAYALPATCYLFERIR